MISPIIDKIDEGELNGLLRGLVLDVDNFVLDHGGPLLDESNFLNMETMDDLPVDGRAARDRDMAVNDEEEAHAQPSMVSFDDEAGDAEMAMKDEEEEQKSTYKRSELRNLL